MVILVVRALSFAGAGGDAHQVRASMLSVLTELRLSMAAGQAIVSRGGTAYLRWHVEPSRTWKLDEVACYPRGNGRGTELLKAFLALADAQSAPVSLWCPASRIEWYRRHGFRLQAPGVDSVRRAYLAAGLIEMRRRAFNSSTLRPRALVRPAHREIDIPAAFRPVPAVGDRVKTLMTSTRQKQGAVALVLTTVLLGTQGCSPTFDSPIYQAYTAGSDLHR